MKKPIEIRGHLPDGHPYMITDRSGKVQVSFNGRVWALDVASNTYEAEDYLAGIIHEAFSIGEEYAKKNMRNELRAILGLPTED